MVGQKSHICVHLTLKQTTADCDHQGCLSKWCHLNSSLQLQAPEPIPETQETYGVVRPYRESPLLARTRRTESFSSYR